MKPSFDRVDELSFFSGTFDLQANIAVSPGWNVILSMPYSTFSYGEQSGYSSIGNLFIGAQTHSNPDSIRQSIGTFGLYVPTTPEDEEKERAHNRAALTNWHEFYRYYPKHLTVYANIASIYHTAEGLFYGFELGPNVWVPTGSGDREVEFLLHYGITGGVNVNQLIINAELVGLFLLSAETDSFSDKFYHSLVFNAQYTGWPVQPQLFYKLYLEQNLTNQIDGVLGLGLTFVVQ
jgi:hypothetical protein